MSLFSPQKRLIFRYLPFILRSNIRRENKQEESTVHLLFSVYLDGNDGRKRKRFISKTCVEPQLVSACNRAGSLHDVYSSHGRHGIFIVLEAIESLVSSSFTSPACIELCSPQFGWNKMDGNLVPDGSLISFQEYLGLILICRAKSK